VVVSTAHAREPPAAREEMEVAFAKADCTALPAGPQQRTAEELEVKEEWSAQVKLEPETRERKEPGTSCG
jgi:hypothetical protein